MLMIASALPEDASVQLAQACAHDPELTFAAASESAIQAFLDADSHNLVLVFMEFAAENLARIIHADPETLAAQAEGWRQNAEAMLDLHDRAPARVHLLSLQTARQAPQVLLSRFGLELSLPAIPTSDYLPSLLAQHWLGDKETLRALDLRLRTCCPMDYLPAELAQAAARFSAAQSAQLAAYREENSLLLRQLHLAQEQLASRPAQAGNRPIAAPKAAPSMLHSLLQRYRASRHRAKFKTIERIVRPLLSRAYHFTKRLMQK